MLPLLLQFLLRTTELYEWMQDWHKAVRQQPGGYASTEARLAASGGCTRGETCMRCRLLVACCCRSSKPGNGPAWACTQPSACWAVQSGMLAPPGRKQ